MVFVEPLHFVVVVCNQVRTMFLGYVSKDTFYEDEGCLLLVQNDKSLFKAKLYVQCFCF